MSEWEDGGGSEECARRCARRLESRASSVRRESSGHATTDWQTPFVRSSGGSRGPPRAGLEKGDSVLIVAPRIGESVPVAIERPCRAGRTAKDHASRTTGGEG